MASGMLPTDMFKLTTSLCNLPIVSVGPSMAQVVSWYPVTREVRVSSSVSPCWICDGTIALGQVFLQVFQFFPFILIPLVLHVRISRIYHQCSIILAFGSAIKEITTFPFPHLVSMWWCICSPDN